MYSDISLGDSWGLGKSKQGLTAAVCWTRKGEELLKDAEKNGYINIEPADFNMIAKGQDISARKSRWTNSISIWKEKGKYVPDYGPPVPPAGHKGKSNRKTAKRFKRSLRLFSSGSSEEFERKFRHMRLQEFLPFKIKALIVSVAGMVLKRK